MKHPLDNIAWAASLWAVSHTLPPEVGAGLALTFLALALWGMAGRVEEWRRGRRVRWRVRRGGSVSATSDAPLMLAKVQQSLNA